MTYSDNDWKDVNPHIPPGYDNTKFNVVFDHHSHTNYSDGALTIKQNVEWHIAMGFNAIAITDHNNMHHLEEVDNVREDYAKKGFLILSGIEWTTDKIHLNLLGLTEWESKISYRTTEESIIETINKAHDLGAIVVCDHIPWSINEFNMNEHPSRESLLEWGIDYIEIINDDSKPENVYDHESYDFCVKHNNEIGMITGTDMHKPDGLAGGGVHGWTLLNIKEFTEDALIEELLQKNTKVIYSKTPYLDPGIHKEK